MKFYPLRSVAISTVAFALKPLHEALEGLPEHHYRTYVHTDQGFQYQSYAWRKELKSHRVCQSMSRKATCLDNAQMESFFHIMKAETVSAHDYQTQEELERAMREWIKYYNKSRIKEKLGGLSPIDYRISTTKQVAKTMSNFWGSDQKDGFLSECLIF